MGYAAVLFLVRYPQSTLQGIGFNTGRARTDKTDFFLVFCTLVKLFKAFTESPDVYIENCTFTSNMFLAITACFTAYMQHTEEQCFFCNFWFLDPTH